jgi:hypothetical protein
LSSIYRFMAAALLAILALLLFTSVRQESPTFNKSTHLFAGFEYWVSFRGSFRVWLNRH